MKKIILYSILLFTFASCKKSMELDIPNPNVPDESNFWQTGTDALLGVNAVYGNFYRNGAPFSRWMPFYMDVRSDDGYSTSPWNELRSIGAHNITQYSFEVNYDTWWHHWRGVYRANQVLARVPSITMDENLKNRYLGEAKFLRALYYYNLVTIWGNIPLILEPSQPSDKPFQAPQEQVWAQIEKDLTEAAAALPPSYNNDNIGRATKGAAYALLGRVHLQQKEYQPAVDALRWLVEGDGRSLYDLTANYADNFRHTTENNIESVFEIQFKMRAENSGEDGPTSNVGTSRAPFFGPPGHGFNDANMNRWVVHEFLKENTTGGQRDPRLAITALYDSTDVRGPDFSIVYGGTFTSKNYDANTRNRVWYRKYLDDYFRINEFEIFNSPVNFRVIRFADVLLMYAEALNEVNRTAEAYAHVDRVRQRAGLQRLSVTMPGMNKEQFLRQLMHERITELTGECTRWNDLARWGFFDDATKLAELKARDPEFNNFVIGRNKYMPIPQTEIDINPNLKQNDNW
ncbi:RagB/SusD family nutrient uptake outer membrane protein [Parasegetibacter sp. NRK P23]|uniref:RagB/SusD family nutrient uptake outer membrane protein n=1 Tax=Parasegetibacter sp. NRK P23 TaxID=2942999 RepID=UPI00204448F8|nr:RagB/SusD family nutrient uptake outer membrane protein [Parasegetibacter sp. NRK P23]MCM5528250.1 RagB/SusD family nutrient uptake outer membrane protein [Parasegetibacter sp. NRK P23]